MESIQPEIAKVGEDDFSQLFSEFGSQGLSLEDQLTPDVQTVLTNLLRSYKRLRSASYRIGYLEGQVKKYRQLSPPPVTAQQAMASNPQSLVDSSQAPPTLSSSAPLRTRLAIPSQPIRQPNELDLSEVSWWHSLAEVLVGNDQPKGTRNRGKRNSGNNYYDLIRRSI